MTTTTSVLSPISLEQFYYENGNLVRPARLFFSRPGTVDAVTVYTDAALTVPHDVPVVTSGKGRCPPVYVGTEPYRIRVFDSHGSMIEEIPWLPGSTVVAPPEEGTVSAPDPEEDEPPTALTDLEKQQLLQTGDMIHNFCNGLPREGFVRANGMLLAHPEFSGVGYNIENQDPLGTGEKLFILLWGNSTDAILPVIGGRGSSAVNDWNAKKAITLPDLCGRSLRGIDGMGAPLKNRMLGTNWVNDAGVPTGVANAAGSTAGAALRALTLAQMPAHTHTVSGAFTGMTIAAAATGVTTAGAVANISSINTGITIAANHTGISLVDPGHAHGFTAVVAQNAYSPPPGDQIAYANSTTASATTGIYLNDPWHAHGINDPWHAHPQSVHVHAMSDPWHTHTVSDPSHGHTLSTVGSSAAVELVDPTMVVTVYIKL